MNMTIQEIEAFLSKFPGGFFRYAADEVETLDYVSKGVLDLYGYTEKEFRTVTGNVFSGMVYPDDLDAVQASIREQVEHGDDDKVTYRIQRKDGAIRWVEDSGRIVTNEDGSKWFYVVILDITDKIEYQNQLYRSNERLHIIASLVGDVVFDLDYKNGKAYVYGDFVNRFGRSPANEDFAKGFVNEASDVKMEPPVCKTNGFKSTHTDRVEKDISLEDNNGKPIWCRYQAAIFRDQNGIPVRNVGRLLDIHEQKLKEKRMEKRAMLDSLTGLYHRESARKIIENVLSDPKAMPYILLLFDIDNFKTINDTYGHPMGDKVLCHFADLLRQTFGQEDTVARLGGDEFLVFCRSLTNKDEVKDKIRWLSNGTVEDFKLDGQSIPVSFSIGVVFSEEKTETFSSLYQKADFALYQAKRKGKNNAYLY